MFFLLAVASCKTTKDKDANQITILADGKTDVSTAIMEALNQSALLVLGKDKTYLIKQPLLLKSGQKLDLNGSTLLFDFIEAGVGIDILDESGVTVKNGKIKRRKNQKETVPRKAFRSNSFKALISGIYCNTANNTFENLILENWMTGIRLSNFSTKLNTYQGLNENNRIKDCKFYGNHFGILIKGQINGEISNIEGDYGTEISGIKNMSPPHLLYVAGAKSSNSVNTNLSIENVSCSDSHSNLDTHGSCITMSNVKKSTLKNVYVNNCDAALTVATASDLMIENITMEDMRKSCIKTDKNTNRIHIKKVSITQTGFSKNAVAINGKNFLLEDFIIKYGKNNPRSTHYTLSIRGTNNTVKNISFDNDSDQCNYIILDRNSKDNKIINLKMKGKPVTNKQRIIMDKGEKNIY